jgi:hypothetical protein
MAIPKGIVVRINSTFDPKGLSTAEKRMAKFGRAANAILLGVGAIAVTAVKGANEAAIAQSKLANVLDSMGYEKATDRVAAYAEALETTLAVDADVIKATQTKLATFGNLTKSVGEAGGAFDRATMAALDLAAAGFGTAEGNAVSLGKALQDPVKGISALSRAGVTFTENEKEKIKTLVESNKTLEAQDMILAAIEKQVGGTAEASADDFVKMQLAINKVLDAIGNALLPYLDDLAIAVQKGAQYFEENKTVILTLVGAVTALAAIFKVITIATAIYNAVLAANPVVLIVVAILALVAALVLAYKNSETFRKIVDGAFNWIKNAAGSLLEFFKKIPAFFIQTAKTLANVITTPYRLAFAAIAKLWNATIGGLKFTIPDWVPGIGGKGFEVPKLPEGIPALAKGGIVNRPTLALIGEAGPEAVVPLTGRNTPGGINITVNGAIDPEGVARSIERILRTSKLRGGVYA